ncbi:MAG: hypothetical protein H0V01_00695 [Bacteroidetes bacterium]|nr:hypothetical protein [Bacteroidota bacterium]HET6243396.1 hypothetical protein [Bacteroidia bacterium]
MIILKVNQVINYILCALSITIFLACQTGYNPDHLESKQQSTQDKTTGQAVEQLDQRIGELNEEITSVERHLIQEEKFNQEEIMSSWLDIEAKRLVLNQTIDSYNTAVQENQENQADLLKKEINTLLDEIQLDVTNLKEDAKIDGKGVFE